MTHDPIQRWGLEWNTSAGRDFVVPDYQGRYVTYDDHVEAIRQAEQRVLMLLKKIQIEVSDEWDTSGYSIYKDYRKEVFCRVRDALQEEK